MKPQVTCCICKRVPITPLKFKDAWEAARAICMTCATAVHQAYVTPDETVCVICGGNKNLEAVPADDHGGDDMVCEDCGGGES